MDVEVSQDDEVATACGMVVHVITEILYEISDVSQFSQPYFSRNVMT